jgi:predicted dehydrogenase
MNSEKMNRRNFIGTTAAVAAATIVPRRVLGGANFVAPSDKINVAIVGLGTQTLRMIFEYLKNDNIQITHVCDVNRDSQDYPEWGRFDLRRQIRQELNEPTWGAGDTGCRCGREVGRAIVENFYRTKHGKSDWKGVGVWEDFRELFGTTKDVDGVWIMTPDHSHAYIAYQAMRKGKHVIMHKPLSNIISEVRLVSKIAEETGVATHMYCAAHKHTTPLIKEWITEGAIGQVKEVHNWSRRPVWPQGMTEAPRETPTVPSGFNWDLWLGPEEYRPFHPAYTHTNFRGWYDFGAGPLGDMGHYSGLQTWNILELGDPTSVEGSRSEFWDINETGQAVKKVNTVSYPRASTVHWEFPARNGMPDLDYYWYDGGIRPTMPKELEKDGQDMPDEGLLFVGENGKLFCGFSGDRPQLIPEKSMRAFVQPPKTLPRPVDELSQWVQACRGERPARARFQEVRAINEALLLGSIAYRVPQKLHWDSKSMRFTNSEDANKLLFRKYRSGWELPVA